MSAKVMGRAWDLDLPHNQLLVLLALADHADHDGNNVFPSLGLVAWKTGYSEQQVRRVIRELVKLAILVVVSKSPGRTIKYKIAIDAGIMKEPYTPSKMSPLSKSNPLHSDTTDPLQNVTPTPDMTSAKIDVEPSVEPSINHSADATPQPKQDTIAIYIKAWLDGQLVKPATASTQYGNKNNRAIAKAISEAGFTPQQVTDYTKAQASTAFWSGKLVPLKNVGDNIAASVKKSQPQQWSDIPELRGVTEIIR